MLDSTSTDHNKCSCAGKKDLRPVLYTMPHLDGCDSERCGDCVDGCST